MKKLIPLVFLAISPSLFADTFFSGNTGLSANFINKRPRSFKPALVFTGFLSGQFALTKALSVRGEFSLQTSDLYDNGITNEADSTFQINELSASYVKSFAYATHTLSFFKGHFEPIGSQQFIQRRLGVADYSSPLTERYYGNNAANAYDLHGTGGSYSFSLKILPVSSGIVISRDNETDDEPEINGDWRLAFAFRYLTADFLLGIGAPIYTKNEKTGEEVFLLIDTAYLHSGIDLLLGSRYSFVSLYALGGFDHMTIRSSKKTKSKLKAKDTYLLVEPRFSVGNVKVYFTGYNIPQSRLGTFMFIDDTIGANIRIFNDGLSTEKRNFTLGLNGSVGLDGKFLDDIAEIKFDEIEDILNVKITPFAEIEANKGKLKIALQVNAAKIKNEKPNAIKLNIGYKKEL